MRTANILGMSNYGASPWMPTYAEVRNGSTAGIASAATRRRMRRITNHANRPRAVRLSEGLGRMCIALAKRVKEIADGEQAQAQYSACEIKIVTDAAFSSPAHGRK